MIKKYEPKFLNDILDIWRETNINSHDFIDKGFWEENLWYVKENLPNALIFVYEENNIVKGFIGITKGYYITGLFVKKEYQSHGIGTQLLDYVKEKFDYLELHVYLKNKRAIEFYEENKFVGYREDLNVGTQEYELKMSWKQKSPFI